jgi:hypothetical protein
MGARRPTLRFVRRFGISALASLLLLIPFCNFCCQIYVCNAPAEVACHETASVVSNISQHQVVSVAKTCGLQELPTAAILEDRTPSSARWAATYMRSCDVAGVELIPDLLRYATALRHLHFETTQPFEPPQFSLRI